CICRLPNRDNEPSPGETQVGELVLDAGRQLLGGCTPSLREYRRSHGQLLNQLLFLQLKLIAAFRTVLDFTQIALGETCIRQDFLNRLAVLALQVTDQK